MLSCALSTDARSKYSAGFIFVVLDKPLKYAKMCTPQEVPAIQYIGSSFIAVLQGVARYI